MGGGEELLDWQVSAECHHCYYKISKYSTFDFGLAEGLFVSGKILWSVSQSLLVIPKNVAKAHSFSPQDTPDPGTSLGVSGWAVATFKMLASFPQYPIRYELCPALLQSLQVKSTSLLFFNPFNYLSMGIIIVKQL